MDYSINGKEKWTDFSDFRNWKDSMIEGKGSSLAGYSWLTYWGMRRIIDSDSVENTVVSYHHLNFRWEVWWPNKKRVVHIYDMCFPGISFLFIGNLTWFFLWEIKSPTIHMNLVGLPITVYPHLHSRVEHMTKPG